MTATFVISYRLHMVFRAPEFTPERLTLRAAIAQPLSRARVARRRGRRRKIEDARGRRPRFPADKAGNGARMRDPEGRPFARRARRHHSIIGHARRHLLVPDTDFVSQQFQLAPDRPVGSPSEPDSRPPTSLSTVPRTPEAAKGREPAQSQSADSTPDLPVRHCPRPGAFRQTKPRSRAWPEPRRR